MAIRKKKKKTSKERRRIRFLQYRHHPHPKSPKQTVINYQYKNISTIDSSNDEEPLNMTVKDKMIIHSSSSSSSSSVSCQSSQFSGNLTVSSSFAPPPPTLNEPNLDLIEPQVKKTLHDNQPEKILEQKQENKDSINSDDKSEETSFKDTQVEVTSESLIQEGKVIIPLLVDTEESKRNEDDSSSNAKSVTNIVEPEEVSVTDKSKTELTVSDEKSETELKKSESQSETEQPQINALVYDDKVSSVSEFKDNEEEKTSKTKTSQENVSDVASEIIPTNKDESAQI